jgi:F420-dependent oxidoreductase-like protein
MDLALHVSDFTGAGDPARIAPTLAATARAADTTGFSTLTLMDHFFQMQDLAPATDPMLEGYTALGFLAGQTEHLQLGLLVTGVTYRHPGLLAKTVTTLDVLSGGRALLGIGAAWYEREHLGLGVPFPPVAERFERLDEALRVVKQMWSDEDGPFAGTFSTLAETLNSPQVLRRPHPPILIGGMGERKTLRLVARHADACNLFAAGPDVIAHKVAVLAGHCETEGRDPSEIATTVIGGPDPLEATEDFLAAARACAGLGVSTLWVGAPLGHPDPAAWVTRVGTEVLPRVRDL